MDKETIKKELETLISEGMYIYYSAIIKYGNNIIKDPDELLQELSKKPPSVFSKELFESFSKEPSKKISEETFQKVSKLAQQQFLKDSSKKAPYPKDSYQSWYDLSYKIISICSPRRLEEFERLYTGDKTIKNDGDLNFLTAGIIHYFQNLLVQTGDLKKDFFITFASNFTTQRSILLAISKNFDNPLFNLENDIRSRIYESELDIAKDIQDQGHLKIAGAVAGVIIEAHLKTLVAKRKISIKTQNNKPPTMDDYNNALKKDDTYDTATWRLIQRCGDIRNDCAHSNEDKPTKKETDDIIRAAEQIIADYN